MNSKITVALFCLFALAVARPSDDVIDVDYDAFEHEQEGVPGSSVTGEYTALDANGDEYTIKYIADHLGFRVLEQDLPEVRAADSVEEEEEDED